MPTYTRRNKNHSRVNRKHNINDNINDKSINKLNDKSNQNFDSLMDQYKHHMTSSSSGSYHEDDNTEKYRFSSETTQSKSQSEYVNSNEQNTNGDNDIYNESVNDNSNSKSTTNNSCTRSKSGYKSGPKSGPKPKSRQSCKNSNSRCNKTSSTSDQSTSCKPNTFYYDIPNSTLLVLFITVAIILAIVGLTIYRYFLPHGYFTYESNSMTSVYIGIIGVPVGIVLGFVITGVWESYNQASANNEKEAADLLFLYETLEQIPGTGKIRCNLREYIVYVVNTEFPLMRDGIIPSSGLNLLLEIGNQIRNLNPSTEKEAIMYRQSIEIYREALSSRAARIAFQDGIQAEIWWVLIIGVVILIMMSWLVYCRYAILQYILTIFVAAGLAALLFLAVALDNPYQGEFSLEPTSFRIALSIIDGDTTANIQTRRRRRGV